MSQHEKILNFISKFTDNNKRKEVIECFTQGCCYWFAKILLLRFNSGNIVYDGIDGHFGYFNKLTKCVYDITGDVTNIYKWQDWTSLNQEDSSRSQRIIHNCILMEE